MKNFWCEGDKILAIREELKPLYADLKQYIISEMNKQCWIEGKDYEFGYSEINNYPCVFYHYVYINGEKTGRSPQGVLSRIIRDGVSSVSKDYSGDVYLDSKDILSAFSVSIQQICSHSFPEFGCLLLCGEELNEAVANEPDRWDFYLAHKED